jgi:hypothetical protein
MAEPATSGTLGRKLPILIAVLVVIVAAWTGGWFWLKGEAGRRMDAEIAKLAARGITITCANRTIEGWPFRLDIDCDDAGIAQVDQLTSVKLKHLRLTALIYNPTLVIAEMDGPLVAAGPRGELVNASWSLLHASLGLSLTPTIKPDRLAVAGDAITASFAKPGGQDMRLTTKHAEIHARPAPDATAGSIDADLALSLAETTFTNGDKTLGPEKVDWSMAATARHLPQAPGPDGFMRTWASNQAHLDIRSAKMGLGGFTLEGKGGLDVLFEGLVDGRIKLTATNLAALMGSGQTGKGRAELIGLATAFTIFGKSAGPDAPAGSRTLDVVVDHSQIKVGPTAVGRLPPLF